MEMVAAVKADVTANPAPIGLLGADRVVAYAQLGANTIHQPRPLPPGGYGERLDLSHGSINEA
jgi:hypothetical protein